MALSHAAKFLDGHDKDGIRSNSAWVTEAAADGLQDVAAELPLSKNIDVLDFDEFENVRGAIHKMRLGFGSSGRKSDPVFLQKEEQEILELCEAIATKAAQKFRTTREALRNVDAHRDGNVTKSEMYYFFRAYNLAPEAAEKFFAYLDPEKLGEVPYTRFVRFVCPFIHSAMSGSGKKKPPMHAALPDVDADDLETTKAEFKDVLNLIEDKAAQKFTQLRHAFRAVERNEAGTVKRGEFRHFFRAFNIPQETADQVFQRLDRTRNGEVTWQDFQTMMGPVIQPDHYASKLTSPRKTPRAFAGGQAEDSLKSQAAVQLYKTHTSDFEPPKMMRLTTTDGLELPPGRKLPELSPREGKARQTHALHGDAFTEGKQLDLKTRRELRKLMSDIGTKLPLKFKHVRDAFRVLDLQRNGCITRVEMRGFFRGFGHDADVADTVFDLCDEDGTGEVDFASFMLHFDPVLGPAFRQAKREPRIKVEDPRLSKEVNDIAAVIEARLTTKYRSVHDAFRALDLNKDGTVSKSEMRTFVRNFGMSNDAADKMFKALDTDNAGDIMFNKFMALFSSHDGLDKQSSMDEASSPRSILKRLS